MVSEVLRDAAVHMLRAVIVDLRTKQTDVDLLPDCLH